MAGFFLQVLIEKLLHGIYEDKMVAIWSLNHQKKIALWILKKFTFRGWVHDIFLKNWVNL